MTISGKVFLVTGAGSGLGREVALLLVKKGAKGVVIIDINDSSMQQTKELAGDNSNKISTHNIDITNLEAVRNLEKKVREVHGGIDALINNAGIIQPFKRIETLDLETALRVMNINFNGTLYMTKTFLPQLIEKKEAHIVNVSSMGSFFSVPGQTVYGASKAAVNEFTNGLRLELRDTNCKVTVAIPGAMNTNILTNSGQKMSEEMKEMQKNSKTLSASKAAEILVDAMVKNKSSVLIGRDAKFLNFMNKFFPSLTTKLFMKFVGSKLVVE